MGDASTPEKPKVARKLPLSTNPKTYDMMLEAITSLTDRKGASVPAIKSFILEKYPTVDANQLKSRLRKALEKGMEVGVIARPKNATETGASLSGRFRVDKAKLASLDKPKAKPKPKVTAVKPKVPKSPKAAKAKTEQTAKPKPKKVLEKAVKTPKKATTKKTMSAKKSAKEKRTPKKPAVVTAAAAAVKKAAKTKAKKTDTKVSKPKATTKKAK